MRNTRLDLSLPGDHNAEVNTCVLIQGHSVTSYKLRQLVTCNYNYFSVIMTLKLY